MSPVPQLVRASELQSRAAARKDKQSLFIDVHAELAGIAHTAYCWVIEAMKLHYIQSGRDHREPTRVMLTPVLEGLLRANAINRGDRTFGTHKTPKRPAKVMGMTAVYDAPEFKLLD